MIECALHEILKRAETSAQSRQKFGGFKQRHAGLQCERAWPEPV